jgi:hypothetical protein
MIHESVSHTILCGRSATLVEQAEDLYDRMVVTNFDRSETPIMWRNLLLKFVFEAELEVAGLLLFMF